MEYDELLMERNRLVAEQVTLRAELAQLREDRKLEERKAERLRKAIREHMEGAKQFDCPRHIDLILYGDAREITHGPALRKSANTTTEPHGGGS